MEEKVLTEFVVYNDEVIYLENIYVMEFGWNDEGEWHFDINCNLKAKFADEDIWREPRFKGQEAIDLFNKFMQLKGKEQPSQ